MTKPKTKHRPPPEAANDTQFNLSLLERDVLIRAINYYGGNMQRVSEALGVNRTTAYRMIKRHGVVCLQEYR